MNATENKMCVAAVSVNSDAGSQKQGEIKTELSTELWLKLFHFIPNDSFYHNHHSNIS